MFILKVKKEVMPMKKKKQKLLKNIIFTVILFMLPIIFKVLNLKPLELIAIIVATKRISEIYSNFNLGIILHTNFGYYH